MTRRLDIDALRGLMLVLMTFTHLPTRFASPFGQPLGFVSSAEGFVFLSAFMCGWIYSERAKRDGLFRTRRIDRLDRSRSAALVNAQHELAFRKRAVRLDGEDVDSDPLVAGWRREIASLRA